MGDSHSFTPREVAIGTAVLILGAVGIGLAAPLVKLSAMEPTALAFWRMLLAIPAGLIWAGLDRKPRRQSVPAGWRKYAYLTLPGILFAGDLAFWHSGIKITTVANATFLANLQPVFVVLASWLIFKERPARAFLIAAAVAVSGAGLLSAANISIAPERLPGDALSLIEWSILLGLALGVQIFGQGGVAFGLGRVPAPVASVILLVQPVVSAIAGWLMFGEALIAIQIFGAGLVLTGVWLAQRRNRTFAAPRRQE